MRTLVILVLLYNIPTLALASGGCADSNDKIWAKEKRDILDPNYEQTKMPVLLEFETKVLTNIQSDFQNICQARISMGKSLAEEFKPLTEEEAAHCETLVNKTAILERSISARATFVTQLDSFLKRTQLKYSGGLKQSIYILENSKQPVKIKNKIEKELYKVWQNSGSQSLPILGKYSVKAAMNERENDCSKMRNDAKHALTLIAALVKNCGANDRGHFRGAINTSLELCSIPALVIPGENKKSKQGEEKICQYNKITGKKFDLSSYNPSERIKAFKKFTADKNAGKYEARPCK